jgi:two-component system response regulator HydG
LDVFSATMRRLVEVAKRAACVESTVLITGESGVGKERLARFIHRMSARARAPFIPVNCGALTESLIESELFGHARGSFTGAVRDREGLFEAANGGTLMLDEIGELPYPAQVKLLRVLQDREVRRVGENRQHRVNVRLIAATNRDLAQDVAARRFREDLYYRLKVVKVHIPPLRERLDDLRGLAEAFLRRMTVRMGLALEGFSSAALQRILEYTWPGNIRELENAIESACALATGLVIDVDDLPDELRCRPALAIASPGIRPLREVEREYILAALQQNGGNRHQTAQQLRIATATLFRKLREYTTDAAA